MIDFSVRINKRIGMICRRLLRIRRRMLLRRIWTWGGSYWRLIICMENANKSKFWRSEQKLIKGF